MLFRIKRFSLFLFYSSFALASPPSQIHLKRETFYNYENEPLRNHQIDCLKIFLKRKFWHSPSPTEEELKRWTTAPSIIEREKKPTVTWIGHATSLIQIEGLNILTDPTFYDLSLVHQRLVAPAFMPNELPPIDVVLLSHNHRDHCDKKSLGKLVAHNPLVLIPKGDAPLLKKIGFKKVKEFLWWEKETVKTSSSYKDVTFSFLPATHWSNRGLSDLNKSAWGSWMIGTKDHHIYFAGDSAYDKHYKEIAAKYPSIDIALMPIAPNGPREENKKTHMSASESVQAFLDLSAKTFIPIHWGTYPLGTDSFIEPIELLLNAWNIKKKELSTKKLCTLNFGASYKEINKEG
jgi:L-ascorbate metabolism protein UlaG (beta-lactamase superfamily)